ncbi:MAG: riboflavin biosynthesis protein RibF [Akkermansia sp.]
MMTVIHTMAELQEISSPIHWAMGVFDGIHIGHQRVIASAVDSARQQGELAGVLTFEQNPLCYLRPADAPAKLLADNQEKIRLMESLGVELILSLKFDASMAQMSPDCFLKALRQHDKLASISVGDDWKFGKSRAGNIHFLLEQGRQNGFGVHIIPPVLWNGERVSSTRIRQAVAMGEMEAVAGMLGRPFTLTGTVIHGRQLARQLGFPTANIRPLHQQLPPKGVYAVRVSFDGKIREGIANLGQRPTVEQSEGELLLEVHLLEANLDLYGRDLCVECLRYLRPEMKFESIDLLQMQMTQDVELARKVLFESR